MEHYAGIDVSLERSSVCVVDSTVNAVRETPCRPADGAYRRSASPPSRSRRDRRRDAPRCCSSQRCPCSSSAAAISAATRTIEGSGSDRPAVGARLPRDAAEFPVYSRAERRADAAVHVVGLALGLAGCAGLAAAARTARRSLPAAALLTMSSQVRRRPPLAIHGRCAPPRAAGFST